MGLVKKIIRQSLFIIVPLSFLSLLPNWDSKELAFLRLFGNPNYMTISIILGAIIGIANLKGMIWGIESMLGTTQANLKLVFLSLLRLFILFAIIIILAALHRINLLGLLLGMTVVFIFLIKEGLKMAKEQ
ncbi:MAG TPA: hypothetical protein DCP92_20835 [Nitrospiraceae bacterium]|jgi:hypothetical protein|nr:hypothetical protein [Nitrospiraceae bacterium]